MKKLFLALLLLIPVTASAFSFSDLFNWLKPNENAPLGADLRIITAPQGGTNIGSVTVGDVGSCLKVLDDSPFLWTVGTCGTGGGGSGNVATSSQETAGYLPYWTSTNSTPATLGKVATTTVSCSGDASCTPFTVIGASPITINSTGGAGGTWATTSEQYFWSQFRDLTVQGTGYLAPTTTRGFIFTASSTANLLTSINSTSTNATSTNLYISGDTRLASLTGLLKASTGVVTTAISGTDYSNFGASVGPTELQSTDFGDFTCNGTTCSLDATYLTTVDISANTNLAVTYPIVLTNDTLSLNNGGAFSTTSTDYYQSQFRDLSVQGNGYLAPTTTRGVIFLASSTIANLQVVNGSTTNATTSNLTISSLSDGCLSTASGKVTSSGSPCGSGGSASTEKWATSSTDSTAIYPNTAAKVGIGTTTPYLTLDVYGGIFSGTEWGTGATLPTTIAPIGNDESLFVWYPKLGAIYAGERTTTLTTANIGGASANFGQDNTASGYGSLVSGLSNTVSGDYSASFGQSNSVTQRDSYAFGSGNTINTGALFSMAFGKDNIVGNGSSNAEEGFAFGFNNIVEANGGGSIGSNNRVLTDHFASAPQYSLTIGNSNIVRTPGGVSIGGSNEVGDDSYGIGNGVSIGTKSIATSSYALSIGNGVTSGSKNSVTIGSGIVDANGLAASNLINNGTGTIAFGSNSNIPTMVISSSTGVGTVGKVGIGTTSPYSTLSVVGTTTMAVLEATSTTATSTIAGGLRVTGGGLRISTILSCSEALETDGSGNIVCGTDQTGGAGGASTDKWATSSDNVSIQPNVGQGLLVSASSTIQLLTSRNSTSTNSTSTNQYVSGDFWLNAERFSDLTGTGLSNSAGVLTNSGVISATCTGAICSGTNPLTINIDGSSIFRDWSLQGSLPYLAPTSSRAILVNNATSTITNLTMVTSTSTNATTTNLYVSGDANISKLSNLTNNGFVKTGSSNGTLSIDTSTYLTANQTITLSTDCIGSGATSISVFCAGFDRLVYATTYSTTTQATTTPMWFKTTLYSSSTASIPSVIDNLVTINSTSTNATSTNLYVSGQTRVASLNGIIKGATGVLSAAANGTDYTLVTAVSCTNQVMTALTAAGSGTCSSINNAYWSGTDLAVTNGGTGLSTFGGTNHILYTTAADTLASEAAFTYDATADLITTVNASTTRITSSGFAALATGGSNAGVGTGTPAWTWQIASATPYMVITDTNSATNAKHGLFSFVDGVFRWGTSSDALTSTSTSASLDSNQPASVNVGSTTQTLTSVNGLFVQGTNGDSGTSTQSTGKWQVDMYNTAGTRSCMFVVGTTLTVIAGACNP